MDRVSAQWIFMTSRGVPGGLLITIFIMPIFMIMTFVSFLMYLIAVEENRLKTLGGSYCSQALGVPFGIVTTGSN